MNTSYFTLGQQHVHSYNGETLDKDIVIKITAKDPRAKMFELFGPVWSLQYDECPEMEYFPRGIYEIRAEE